MHDERGAGRVARAALWMLLWVVSGASMVCLVQPVPPVGWVQSYRPVVSKSLVV